MTCYMRAKPVYITLPTNVAYAKISSKPLQTPLDLSFPPNDRETEAEAVDEIIEMIRRSRKPIVLADAGAVSYRVPNPFHLSHEHILKVCSPAK